jgi:hypothetical protein
MMVRNAPCTSSPDPKQDGQDLVGGVGQVTCTNQPGTGPRVSPWCLTAKEKPPLSPRKNVRASAFLSSCESALLMLARRLLPSSPSSRCEHGSCVTR